jgi:amino acid adenylation domain-containing protein
MNPTKDIFLRRVKNNIKTLSTKVVVKVNGKSRSFAELDDAASVISNHINRQLAISHKTGNPVRIGVCMSKTEWLMPSIWAILKNGYTYMPIDPQTPVDRIKTMMKDSGGTILLTDGQDFGDDKPECIVLQPSQLEEIESYETIDQTDNHIAYIIYTSGTTGIPKGIPISYDNVVSLLDTISKKEVFGIREESVLMLFASISFDTSIVPIFGSLYYGAKQVIPNDYERTDTTELTAMMKREKVTYVCLPPTLLAQLNFFDFPSMETLVSAGEALIQSAAEKAMNNSYRFINAYGPTECTVFSTFCDVKSATESRNIGVAFPDVVSYVVTDDMQIAKPGELGELMLGGPQLTQGYMNRPELNETAFVKNPFPTKDIAPILYHTGDLVKEMPDGTLDYLGRKDSQVKVRGYRVELGEIKSLLEKCPDVQQSYLRVETIGTEQFIVAYVKTKSGKKSFEEEKAALLKMLPPYMIPTYWVSVDHFETNVNGKVDKSKLRNTALEAFTSNKGINKTAAETVISHIIAEDFGIEDVNIDIDLLDELGLTSIQMMQITAHLNYAGITISPADIMQLRTIRKLSKHSTSIQYYWYEKPVKEKPTMVLVCGYTNLVYLYKTFVEGIKEHYNIFVIDSYHDNRSRNPRTTEEYIDEYLQEVIPVYKEYGIDIITGFCLGGEMGLYMAHRLNGMFGIAPHVIVLDGIPNRFKDRNKNVPLVWKNFSKELNERRVAQDNRIIESMPDFHYVGKTTAILADTYENADPRVLETAHITKEQDEGEYYMFEHAEEIWKTEYPDSEVLFLHVGHYLYFMDWENGVKPLIEYFNGLKIKH